MIKNLKKQKGFTLIELMVVIVIIGILVAIALPNFIGAQDRAKISSVKANMHTVQTMLETYGVDWGGTYPSTVGTGPAPGSGLIGESLNASNPYYKDFVNPFSSQGMGATGSTPGNSLIDITVTTTVAAQAGKTGFNPSGSTKYYLYGFDKVGAVVKDKGTAFTLSNS
ncbi:MAG: type II secretion system protein [Candidatus Sericytochromatia bacterium]|nr:type II secretion system protein [Candidatus Sericytochromatia bacterium]